MKTLTQIKKSIPQECFTISPVISWLTLFRVLALVAFFILIESQIEITHGLDLLWKLPALFLLLFFHGQALVGLFVLGHDCGHNSFSKSPLTNLIIGHLSFSPLGNGLVNWSLTHNHHHSHTQLRGQEVDWSKWLLTKEELAKTTWKDDFSTRLGYALPFGVFFWVWLNAIKRGLQKNRRKVQISNLIMWAVMIGIYSSLWFFFGIWGTLKYHAIPATIAMFTGYFLLTIQHANEKTKWFKEESWTPVRGQLEATFDVRFPRLFEWLWLDINIHVPHHVAPSVPWYGLRNARLALLKDHPELYQERPFSLREVRWMLTTPTIRELSDQKVYELVLARP